MAVRVAPVTVRVGPVPVGTVVTLWHTENVQQEKKEEKKRELIVAHRLCLKTFSAAFFLFFQQSRCQSCLKDSIFFECIFQWNLHSTSRGDDQSSESHQAVKSAPNVAIILYSRVFSVKTAGDEVTMNQFSPYCA